MLEERGGIPPGKADAAQLDRNGGASFEQRIVRRAGASAEAGKLRSALRDVGRATGGIIFVGLVAAVLAGAGAARAALGESGGKPVNFYWVLSSLLGVQTLLLLLWVLLIAARPSLSNVSPLGSAALALGRRLSGRFHGEHPAHHVAAVQAASKVHASGRIGRWTLSSVSHMLWLSFNVGCLSLLGVLLSTREYVFDWETTILSGEAYVGITEAVAVVPKLLGFPAPTIEQIRMSEAGTELAVLHESRRAWSWLLVGSMTSYGSGPRLVLLLISLVARRRACRRYRLDTSLPGFHRLRPMLMPAADEGGVRTHDADRGRPPQPAAEAGGDSLAERSPAAGPAAIVGLEIDPPKGVWPPHISGAKWLDLGLVDGRDDRQRVLDRLRTLEEKPRVLVVVCALTATPDRGFEGFLERLQGTTGSPLALVLTAGQALRRRVDAEALAGRIEDWRHLAAHAGIDADRVTEVDLDHLTDVSIGRLAELAGLAKDAETGGRRIEPAFALIVEAVGGWSGMPGADEQMKLHHEIAKLYRHETEGWRERLRMPARLKEQLIPTLRQGSDHVLALLPQRLKRSPKWLAAGAASGALGCVAAAMLLSPVAIGALPLWSAIGAAVAAAVQPGSRPGKPSEEEPADWEPGVADAVRSATMFALLLELQGRDEATISRILDAALPDDGDEADDASLGDADQCRAWLAEVRHRLDLALAGEARR